MPLTATRRRLVACLLGTAATLVLAQTTPAPVQRVNIRGTVTAFDGSTLAVDARGLGPVRVALPENVPVSGTRAFSLADVRPGMVLGVTTVQRDGATIAIDVRPIPATANQGLSPFDLAPGSTMTNATLEAQAISAGGSELVLNYRTGTVKVLVPPGTPMSQAVPGTRADIKPGETVFVAATVGEGDRLTAVRVQVSTNGVKPTQ